MTPNPAHVPSLVLCNSRLHKPSRKQPHAPYTPVRHSTRSCTPVRRSTHSCTGARLPAKQCTQFIYGFALDSTNRVPPPPARQTALGPNLGCHPHHLRKLPGCSTSLHVCLTRHAAPVPPVNPWRVARWQLPNTPPPPNTHTHTTTTTHTLASSTRYSATVLLLLLPWVCAVPVCPGGDRASAGARGRCVGPRPSSTAASAGAPWWWYVSPSSTTGCRSTTGCTTTGCRTTGAAA